MFRCLHRHAGFGRVMNVVVPMGFLRQRFAFTGKLLSMPRSHAVRLVQDRGGSVSTSVSRRTNVLIVGMGGWPLLPTGEVSSVLQRAEELNHRGASIRIISEEEFLEEAGQKPRGPALEKSYTADEICDLTGVTREKLRRWEQLGLIRSSAGRFDFQDLISLRTLTELIERGVRPAVINRSLRGLGNILPGTDRPLAQLQIVVENSRSLMGELDGCQITAEGQFMLNFDGPADNRSASLEWKEAEPEGADSWLERGRQFEENEEFDQATDAYRQAISLEPASATAFFNLGNVLRAQDRPDAALELFRLAVTLDSTLTEAWYNIADIHEEEGRIPEAIVNLKQSIAVCPTFADAYYNLALCFEKLGERPDAKRCWSEYLRLDPASDWSNVARMHLATR
jgi:tetratricopeptide (TPR) repeat protein